MRLEDDDDDDGERSCWSGSARLCRGWSRARRTTRWPACRRSWRSTACTGASTSRRASSKRPSSRRSSTRCRPSCASPTDPPTCPPRAAWFPYGHAPFSLLFFSSLAALSTLFFTVLVPLSLLVSSSSHFFLVFLVFFSSVFCFLGSFDHAPFSSLLASIYSALCLLDIFLFFSPFPFRYLIFPIFPSFFSVLFSLIVLSTPPFLFSLFILLFYRYFLDFFSSSSCSSWSLVYPIFS